MGKGRAEYVLTMTAFEIVRDVAPNITASSPLEDIGDSLELLALIQRLEIEFDTRISDEKIREMYTVHDLISAVQN